MEVKQLLKTRDNYCKMLENAILEFVRENGEEATDSTIFNFDLEDEGEITKIWNFYDNGGCWFFEPTKLNSNEFDDMDDENYSDVLYDSVDFSAYLCLYIVVEDGCEKLKYYRFVNGGVVFDEDQADPQHGYVNELSLSDLDWFVAAMKNK